MQTIFHLGKRLEQQPAVPIVAVSRIVVRAIAVPDDIADWLALRERATADLRPAPRAWTAADFDVEMLGKSWWQRDRTWLAVASESTPQLTSRLVGAVTLAMREGNLGSVPVVHWLLVDPSWRRRGVGRLLMKYLERAAWDAGHREVQLETHSGWTDAVAFYEALGYLPSAIVTRPPAS